MSQVDIVKGQEDWQKPIEDMFTEIFGGGSYSDTGWQTAGITYINGASANGNNSRYRVFRRGSFGLTVFNIGINFPAMTYGQATNFVSLPAAMMAASVDMDFGNLIRTGGNQLAGWGFNSNNLFINAFGDWTSTNSADARGFFIFKNN